MLKVPGNYCPFVPEKRIELPNIARLRDLNMYENYGISGVKMTYQEKRRGLLCPWWYS
jgi:hypothetical protein